MLGGTIDSGSMPGSRRESVQSGFDFSEPPVSADGSTRRNSVAEYQERPPMSFNHPRRSSISRLKTQISKSSVTDQVQDMATPVS